MLGEILIAGIASLTLCMFLGPKFIEYLREKEFGQQIREEGPAGHAGKAGTPTMGGLILVLSMSVPFLILGTYNWAALGVFFTAIASGLLGFVDDWTKISHKRSLRVSGRRKLFAQLVISLGLWYIATQVVDLRPELNFRIFDAHLYFPSVVAPLLLGLFFPLFIFPVLAGATSGVTPTDGLDGLAAGCSAIV